MRPQVSGFSYIEVVVTTMVLAVCLVPALDAMRGSLAIVSGLVEVSENERYLQAKMEEVLAEPMAQLDTLAVTTASTVIPTSLSDAAGSVNRRLVYLSRYDGDNADGDNNPFTGTDPGLVWVSTELEGTPFKFSTLTGP